MASKLGILALVIAVGVLVVNGIGCAVPYWYTTEAPAGSSGSVTITTTTYAGVWTSCTRQEVDYGKTLECTDFVNLDDTSVSSYTSGLKAVQALEIIGMVMISLVIVAIILKLCCLPDKSIIIKIAGGVAIGAGVLFIIAPIIYATDVKGDLNFSGNNLSAGFYMCLISGGVAIGLGFLLICVL